MKSFFAVMIFSKIILTSILNKERQLYEIPESIRD